jgi:hypothetical protein
MTAAHPDTGPPPERRGPGEGSRAVSSTATVDTPEHSLTGRQCAAWARRRRAASWRMEALACGCRDPLGCRCTEPPLTGHHLDAWRDTAEHVLSIGQIPLLPLEVRRALWRRPADRELAMRLHQATEGRVA